MLLRSTSLALIVVASVFAGCKGHSAQEDTDNDLFRTPEALTKARELNIAKWTADFVRSNGRLPSGTKELHLPLPPNDPKENPLNDAWGKPIELSRAGKGFELHSVGPDGVPGTADDLLYRVTDPSTEN